MDVNEEVLARRSRFNLLLFLTLTIPGVLFGFFATGYAVRSYLQINGLDIWILFEPDVMSVFSLTVVWSTTAWGYYRRYHTFDLLHSARARMISLRVLAWGLAVVSGGTVWISIQILFPDLAMNQAVAALIILVAGGLFFLVQAPPFRQSHGQDRI